MFMTFEYIDAAHAWTIDRDCSGQGTYCTMTSPGVLEGSEKLLPVQSLWITGIFLRGE
jgi:hypothetical protein